MAIKIYSVLYCGIVLVIWLTSYSSVAFCSTTLHNVTVTDWNPNGRQKRFIIFENGGILKFVAGVTFPVAFGDKKPWRSLNCAYNLQAQFAVPPKPTYVWDRWNGRTLASARMQYDKDGTFEKDISRQFMYALIEFYANKAGKNGRKCLLRAICENASVDEVEGIYAEIIQVILTPGDTDDEYIDAYKAGRYGAICTTLYPECPQGQGILDDIAITETKNHMTATI